MVLSHIFHLSDLHIRNGDNTYSRYEEYKEVFKETIISINPVFTWGSSFALSGSSDPSDPSGSSDPSDP